MRKYDCFSGFNTEKLIFSQFRRPEAQDHAVGRFGFSRGLSPWLAGGRLLAVPSTAFLCVCMSLRPPPLLRKTPVLSDQGSCYQIRACLISI